MSIKKPWLKHYGSVPHNLEYPDLSMVEMLENVAKKHPALIAYEFMGRDVSFAHLMREIDGCARSLRAIGVEAGDRVTVCLPNVPQAIIMIYAINRIGAVANMIHPLSSEGEIVLFINESHSRVAITLDRFYPKFHEIKDKIKLNTLIITSVGDALSLPKRLGYWATQGRKIANEYAENVLMWKSFLKNGEKMEGFAPFSRGGDYPAAILYSGGTTGMMKGILLTNLNFNALALQTAAAGQCVVPGRSVLALMPVFHGFGLGVCIHTMLLGACRTILIPQFTPKAYVSLLKKYRPNFIAGVPTLFETLLRIEGIEKLDLSCLEGVFSGGDSLSIELKRKIDGLLKKCGAHVQIREGYGTTESVTASCLTPKDYHREGSIGIPFPDCLFKIITPNTHEEVPYGEVGEICMTGPTLMSEYLDDPKETALALQLHPDGLTWLHTGDLGCMDEDGFIYFKQRKGRVIISSGYNIYPSQLENAIDAHPDVLTSTVIGVKDDIKMQKVKAFVVLKPGKHPTQEVKESILLHCRKNIAKYAMPYEIEYRESLPRTLVGKVAYTVLEKEEEQKRTNGDK